MCVLQAPSAEETTSWCIGTPLPASLS